MRKHRNYIITIAVLLGCILYAAGPANAINRLADIKVQKAADSIAVIISTSQPCQYHVFLTSTKPERIVLDLTNVVNTWTTKKFMKLPFKSIEAIRTSQFRSDPEPVSRVVLDIGREIDFKEFSERQ